MITGSLTIAIVPVGLAAIVPGLLVVLFLHESNHNISIHHQQTPSLGALAQGARELQVVYPPLQATPLPPPVTAVPAARRASAPSHTPRITVKERIYTPVASPASLSVTPRVNQDFCQQGKVRPCTRQTSHRIQYVVRNVQTRTPVHK